MTKRQKWLIGVLLAVVASVFLALAVVSDQPVAALIATLIAFAVIPAGICFWLLVSWFTLLVHELGHYVVGRGLGMRSTYFQVGPWAVITAAHGRFLQRIGPLFTVNGLCSMTFDDRVATPTETMLYVLGGPIASVLWLAFSLVVAEAAWSTEVQWSHVGWQALLTGVLVLSALSVLLGSILPYERVTHTSDALLLRRLIKARGSPDASKGFGLTLAIQRGLRARDWPLDTICELRAAIAPGAVRAQISLIEYYAWFDRAEKEKAQAAIADAVSDASAVGVPPLVAQAVLYEGAFCTARLGGDPLKAEELLARADKVSCGPNRSLRHRALAAVCEARADDAGARLQSSLAIADLRRRAKVCTPAMQAEIEWNEAVASSAAR